MQSIGIIGAGIAGLHLALFLQQHGIPATLYTERTPDQLRTSRLPHLPARLPHTRMRERALGVDHWHATDVDSYELVVAGEHPLTIVGHSQQPLNSVDMRLYVSWLLRDFADRGGDVLIGPIDVAGVHRLAKQHALIVVATGKSDLAGMFSIRPEHSPHASPQRHLCAGLWHGMSLKAPRWELLSVVPGCGEIIVAPYETFDGIVTGMLIEAVPGGPFDVLTQMRSDDNPRRFELIAMETLRRHAPAIYECIQPGTFELSGPLDILQGKVTPVVRRGYTALGDDKFAVALGDAHVLNDPVTAQGANIASRAAWILGQAIVDDPIIDLHFCRTVEQRILDYALPAVNWTNAMLQPPAMHVQEFIAAASMIPAVADAFVAGYSMPSRLWHIWSDSRRTAVFLREAGWVGFPQFVDSV